MTHDEKRAAVCECVEHYIQTTKDYFAASERCTGLQERLYQLANAFRTLAAAEHYLESLKCLESKCSINQDCLREP